MMARLVWIGCALCVLSWAGEKKSPEGHGEDGSVAITATVLSPEELKAAVGSDFGNDYIVLDVRLTPKGGKPYPVHLDDFILRSEASGEHSGPFLAASQIAGAGTMTVQRTYGLKASPDSPRPLEGTKLAMKDGGNADPALDALKQKMLAEKTVLGPVSGLLFFPLANEKPKHLVLSYKTPESKLRLGFK